MRGWTGYNISRPIASLGYPAHAGMDPYIAGAAQGSGGLPRPCGDGPRADVAYSVSEAVTPPMRGWTPYHYPQRAPDAGYPAHAGMDRGSQCPSATVERLPRPCGDGPCF